MVGSSDATAVDMMRGSLAKNDGVGDSSKNDTKDHRAWILQVCMILQLIYRLTNKKSPHGTKHENTSQIVLDN